MKRFVRLVVVLLSCALSWTGAATSARATGAWHQPTCTGYSACNTAGHSDDGYSSHNGTMYWRQSTGSSDDPGHNCTNYVAYRLIKNGASAGYGPIPGNAAGWGSYFTGKGFQPNSTPAVGAIAWWGSSASSYVNLDGSGHVAYVEKVSSDGSIVVTEDNYGGNFDSRVYEKGTYFPTGFIHLKDVTAVDHAPVGELDTAIGAGSMMVRLAGVAHDPDTTSAVTVSAYINGRRGEAGAAKFDLGKTTSGKFATTLTFKRTWGAVRVFVYATYASKTSLIGSKTVAVQPRAESMRGDFDGDGFDDILWYGPGSGTDRIWFGTGRGTWDTSHDIDVIGTYSPPLVGDFDGDGLDDILWYGPGSGTDRIWFGTGRGTWDTSHDIDVIGTYSPPLVGDFDGDGLDDILWYGPGSGTDRIWFGTGRGTWDTSHDIDVIGTYSPPLVGDFDGDGLDDILWYGPGSGTDRIWFGTGRGTWDTSHDIDVIGTYSPPLVGDFDGDGLDDILWYGPGSDTDRIWFGTGRGTWDTSHDIDVIGTYSPPLVGDFDGDGLDDILWYGPGSGHDAIWFGTGRGTWDTSHDIDVIGTYQPVN